MAAKKTKLEWKELSDSVAIAPYKEHATRRQHMYMLARNRSKVKGKFRYSYGLFEYDERKNQVLANAPASVGGQYVSTGMSPASILYCVSLWRSSAKKAMDDLEQRFTDEW